MLDKEVQAYVEQLRNHDLAEQKRLNTPQKMWALKQPLFNAHIQELENKIQKLEEEIDHILMEKLHSDS